MLTLESHEICFREVPKEITLALNLSNCPHHCEGCHSPWLWTQQGDELTIELIEGILSEPKNRVVTCLAFMGGDNDPLEVLDMNKRIKKSHPDLKTCWYTGFEYHELNSRAISHRINEFDYVKIGPYMKEFGGLDSPTTNQVMFKRMPTGYMTNITKEFQTRGESHVQST